jgi:hypothetical protein
MEDKKVSLYCSLNIIRMIRPTGIRKPRRNVKYNTSFLENLREVTTGILKTDAG